MTLTTRRRVGLGLAVIVFMATSAHAQQFIQTGRDTLRGLPGVEVLVEPLDPELERAGVTGAAIHANVERDLRARGITVYSTQDQNLSPAKAYLYVQVSGLSLQRPGYALAVQVQVRQALRSLVTQSAIVNAMSWDQQIVIVVPAGAGIQAVHV